MYNKTLRKLTSSTLLIAILFGITVSGIDLHPARAAAPFEEMKDEYLMTDRLLNQNGLSWDALANEAEGSADFVMPESERGRLRPEHDPEEGKTQRYEKRFQ